MTVDPPATRVGADRPSEDPCPICRGARWVREVHSNRPWGIEGGCDPGPGMPCSCNPRGGIDDPPDMPPGFKQPAQERSVECSAGSPPQLSSRHVVGHSKQR
jgi:hypothetical protein